MNEALLKIISQQPIYSESCESFCPDCDSTNIKTNEVSHTLVGGDPDPNHYWRDSYCRDCECNFVHEHKLDNHWYTKRKEDVGNFVVKGVANCFEPYVYTCSKCPGFVKRYYTKPDGVTPHTSGIITTSLDGSGPHQREFYGCVICDNVAEVTPPVIKASTATKLLDGWTIEAQEDLKGEIGLDVVESIVKTLTPKKLNE